MYSRNVKLSVVSTASLLACLVILVPPVISFGQQSSVPKKVLLLYWGNKDDPGNISFDSGVQVGLRAEPGTKWELFNEYLDTNRFPGEHQNQLLHDYLVQKYQGVNIDVVVTAPDTAVNFLLKYRADLFPNLPVVFLAAKRPSPEILAAGAGMTGIIQANTHRKTVDLALNLHPDTQNLFVISGTPERDKKFETIARQELAAYQNGFKITYLTDLPLDELLNSVKSLPPHSVILYVWDRETTPDGKTLQTYEVLDRLSNVAVAPIYGMGSRNVGYGIVGGYVQDSERNGIEVAEILRRILNGTSARDIPVESAPSLLMFDWRQVQRWGIPENRLPNDSVVRFKELTFWQQYKWRIIGVLVLFTLQTLVIALLVLERKRRQLAKEALDKLNAELEERIASRTAALDNKSRELETFAYSVAHDLKAPLRGIDGYTRLLLEDHLKNLNDEGRGFLDVIHSSTVEMNQLIDDLLEYSRLERREFKPDRFELKPIISSVIEQKKRELTDSNIEFVLNVNGGSVLADPNGLTQSLRNYIDNAVKFTHNVSNPRIEIGAKENASNVQLWVQDNGVGFDMKYHDRIFDIFQRLNPVEEYPGTGVGLAIVRKAMQRMGGRAWAKSEPGHGATFFLEIPK
jgi:signal transduction histidine kinase